MGKETEGEERKEGEEAWGKLCIQLQLVKCFRKDCLTVECWDFPGRVWTPLTGQPRQVSTHKHRDTRHGLTAKLTRFRFSDLIWNGCYNSAATLAVKCSWKYVGVASCVAQHWAKYLQGINRINMWREWSPINVYVPMQTENRYMFIYNMWHECVRHTIICDWDQDEQIGALQCLFCLVTAGVFVWLLLRMHGCDWCFLFWIACKVSPYLDLSFLAGMQQIAFQSCHDWNLTWDQFFFCFFCD